MEFAVAGVTFENEDGIKRQVLLAKLYDDFWTEGREKAIKLELRPEPDNPVDANAVALYVTAPAEGVGRVGFVPGEHAPKVAKGIKRGIRVGARLEKMNVSKRGVISMVVKLVKLPGGTATHG